MAICVLDPTSEEAVVTSQRTARLTSLAGRTVGLLDNGKLRVHELLNHMEALLRTEHGVAGGATVQEARCQPSSTHRSTGGDARLRCGHLGCWGLR